MTTTAHAPRPTLPQLADQVFMADGGIETTLIYQHGLELPEFAAFVLLDDEQGREELRRYFRPYLELASRTGTGIVLETPTWRASRDWGRLLGHSPDALARANRDAVALVARLREEYATPAAPVVVSGCIGPRGDGYSPESLMTAAEAESFHRHQVAAFADSDVDLVTAITMTHTGEAIGVATAAATQDLPCVISFTVETDGRLPSGEQLGEAVHVVDAATGNGPAYYMVNCAHPSHVDSTLLSGGDWVHRLRGMRSNASTMSHAELDAATSLDVGDIADFGARHAALHRALPHLTVFGGCCGTDVRHVGSVHDALVSGR